MLHNKKLSQGRSMVEMLGVLGIMALITALGIIAYNQAVQMFKMDKLQNEISTIRIHIQTKAQGSDFLKYTHSGGALSDTEIKNYFNDFFVKTGIFNKNISAMGSGTHYGFGNSTYKGLFFLTLHGLTEKECETILLLYKDKGSQYNNCALRSDNAYRVGLYFEK